MFKVQSSSSSVVKSKKKSLPFPLPDPYAESQTFELYDPRGLFKSRRSSNATSISSTSQGNGIGHSRNNPSLDNSISNDILTSGHDKELSNESEGSGIVDSRLSDSLLMSSSDVDQTLIDTQMKDEEEALGSGWSERLPTTVKPALIPPIQTQSPTPKALDPFRRLRIGSSGGSETSSSDLFPLSPIEIKEPIASTSSAVSIPAPSTRHPRRVVSESPGRFNNDDNRSDVSSSQPWSPAVDFLASFSPPSSYTQSSFGGTNFRSIAGDQEGFKVAGFIIGRELGSGGFGVVREAIREADNEKVAVKIVRHIPEAPISKVSTLQRSSSGIRIGAGSRRSATTVGGSGSFFNQTGFERSRSSSSPGPAYINHTSSPSHLSATLPPSPPTITPGLPPPSPHSIIPSLLSREILLWQQLAPHPHIVPLLDVHHSNEFSYIFMPLCEGGNLLTYLNERGGLSANGKRRKSRSSLAVGLRSTVEDREEELENEFDEEEEDGEEEEEDSTTTTGIDSESGISTTTNSTNTKKKKKKPKPSINTSTSIHSSHSRHRGLPLSTCLPIFAQVVSGLHYLHTEAGVVHKDVKLENILLDDTGTWKIADFGLAETGATIIVEGGTTNTKKQLPLDLIIVANGGGTSLPNESILPSTPISSLSRAHSLSKPSTTLQSVTEHLYPAGSLPYSPPEQMKSPTPIVNPSVDIWALGCVLYALVEGKLPMEDEFEPRLRMKILDGDWTIPTCLLSNHKSGGSGKEREEMEKKLVLEVLKGCLEKDVEKRWNIDQVKNCDWLIGDQARGRALGTRRSRSKSIAPPSPSSQNNSQERSRTSRSNSHSTSTSRVRKERSTSRGASHYCDPKTKSLEKIQREKEEKKSRWVEERGRSRSDSRNGSGSRLRSSSRNVGEPY